jgi:hypothetical protein
MAIPMSRPTPSTPIAMPGGRLDVPMAASPFMSNSMPSESPMMTPPTTLDANGRPIQTKKNKCDSSHLSSHI